jgi:K+-sensing histidine kinase KdpD
LPRIAGFVRQVTHDVRNGLNSMDLQAAYLNELISDPEAIDELRRLRGLIQTTARQLQSISGNFWTSTPNLVTYAAKILIEDLRDRLKKTFVESAGKLEKIEWKVELGEESVSVDIEMLFGAITRLFENTLNFAEANGRVTARAFTERGRFILELSESKSQAPATDPETWGEDPFVSTKRGGYGLGIFRAKTLLSVQSGELQISYDSGRNLLVNRVSLPLAHPE